MRHRLPSLKQLLNFSEQPHPVTGLGGLPSVPGLQLSSYTEASFSNMLSHVLISPTKLSQKLNSSHALYSCCFSG